MHRAGATPHPVGGPHARLRPDRRLAADHWRSSAASCGMRAESPELANQETASRERGHRSPTVTSPFGHGCRTARRSPPPWSSVGRPSRSPGAASPSPARPTPAADAVPKRPRPRRWRSGPERSGDDARWLGRAGAGGRRGRRGRAGARAGQDRHHHPGVGWSVATAPDEPSWASVARPARGVMVGAAVPGRHVPASRRGARNRHRWPNSGRYSRAGA